MENNMVVLKNTYLMIGMGLSGGCAFIASYLMDVTMGNAEQYMAVMLVLLLMQEKPLPLWDQPVQASLP